MDLIYNKSCVKYFLEKVRFDQGLNSVIRSVKEFAEKNLFFCQILKINPSPIKKCSQESEVEGNGLMSLKSTYSTIACLVEQCWPHYNLVVIGLPRTI